MTELAIKNKACSGQGAGLLSSFRKDDMHGFKYKI